MIRLLVTLELALLAIIAIDRTFIVPSAPSAVDLGLSAALIEPAVTGAVLAVDAVAVHAAAAAPAAVSAPAKTAAVPQVNPAVTTPAMPAGAVVREMDERHSAAPELSAVRPAPRGDAPDLRNGEAAGAGVAAMAKPPRRPVAAIAGMTTSRLPLPAPRPTDHATPPRGPGPQLVASQRLL